MIKIDKLVNAKASELPVICEVLRNPADVSSRRWVRVEPCDIFGRPSDNGCLVKVSCLNDRRLRDLVSPDKVYTYLVPDSLKDESTKLEIEFELMKAGVI
jgi:hypothetical protein